MAPNLLSAIRNEIDARLDDLRPLLAEYEQLLAAFDVLDESDAIPPSRTASANVAATAARKRAAGQPSGVDGDRARPSGAAGRKRSSGAVASSGAAGRKRSSGAVASSGAAGRKRSSGAVGTGARKPRASRGAAREAILAALEHGSHTIAELVMVTAMSTANISGNVRRLLAEGAVAKSERAGKTAYELAQPAPSA